jgi:tRNA(fMet)-specific endonuclease VapC
MIYLLDTNICIAYLRTPLSSVAQKLATLAPTVVALSAVTAFELFRGAYRSTQVAHNLAQVSTFVGQFQYLPFDLAVADIAGQIDADLMAHGLRIGPYDTLIAATALAHNMILVTHNTREFSRVSGLHLEDWEPIP